MFGFFVEFSLFDFFTHLEIACFFTAIIRNERFYV
jgi:hypothetical protein